MEINTTFPTHVCLKWQNHDKQIYCRHKETKEKFRRIYGLFWLIDWKIRWRAGKVLSNFVTWYDSRVAVDMNNRIYRSLKALSFSWMSSYVLIYSQSWTSQWIWLCLKMMSRNGSCTLYEMLWRSYYQSVNSYFGLNNFKTFRVRCT